MLQSIIAIHLPSALFGITIPIAASESAKQLAIHQYLTRQDKTGDTA